MIAEVGGDELIGDGEVPAVQQLLVGAAKERLVLFDGYECRPLPFVFPSGSFAFPLTLPSPGERRITLFGYL